MYTWHKYMQFLKDLKIPPEISIFLGWVLAIHLMELIILPSLIVPTQLLSNLTLSQRLINIWSSSSDTAHYLLIAQNGYESGNKTLFPLWPIILKIVGANPLSAKIISMFLTFAFFLILIKIIKNLNYHKHTELIILSLISFPSSFMLLSPMSEPLYLLLTALIIFFAEKKRFVYAAIFASLAAATRSIGILLTLYLAIRIIQQGKSTIKKFWWTLLISPLGFILFALYLQFTFGDFALFYKEQAAWGRSIGLSSLQNLTNETYSTFRQIFEPFKPVPINLLHFGLIFFFIFLAVNAYRKMNKGLWLYCCFSIIIPLASGTSVALTRYLLAAFPLFIPLGGFFQKHKTAFYVYLFTSILFQSILIIRFFNFEVAD